jgi:ATP-binding cassette subfamily F protein 3
LGFAHDEHERPVNTFSGGWRMRLNLAQALMCRSTMLLLDEPTNHLDLDAVLWLEDWLRRYPGTLLLITHDRDFLDNVVTVIAHFDHQKIFTYKGNYADFERERSLRLANQQATFEKQQRAVAHLEKFIERFRYKATKAKQVQSRLKQLEKMPAITAAHVDNPFSFAFAPNDSHARQLISLEKAAVGYRNADGDAPILKHVNWSILSDNRIGLLGKNGVGKSTLIRALTGNLPLLSGERHSARELRIGYFAQHQLDTLDPAASALLHLQRIDPNAKEQTLRDFLGGFAFHGDQATQDVSTFSGGERARLALALIVYQKPQLLILDEPTNHLDIEMREALIEALQAFDGALVVVAHDRYLLNATVDSCWMIQNGALLPFDGDLDDYKTLVMTRAKQEAGDDKTVKKAATTDDNAAVDRKTQKRLEAELRQKRAPFVKRQNQIEKELDTLNRDKQSLELWLASPDAYEPANKTQLRDALDKQRVLIQKIEALEEAWMEVEERLSINTHN